MASDFGRVGPQLRGAKLEHRVRHDRRVHQRGGDGDLQRVERVSFDGDVGVGLGAGLQGFPQRVAALRRLQIGLGDRPFLEQVVGSGPHEVGRLTFGLLPIG